MDAERVKHWLSKGAQPSDRVQYRCLKEHKVALWVPWNGERKRIVSSAARSAWPFGVKGWIKLPSWIEPQRRDRWLHPGQIGRGDQWKDWKVAGVPAPWQGTRTRRARGPGRDRDEAAKLLGADIAVWRDPQLGEPEPGRYLLG